MSYFLPPTEQFDNEAVCLLPLSQGKYAVVSPCDFRAAMKHKWSIHAGYSTEYAETNTKTDDGWRRVTLHRFLMGDDDPRQVDHKNHNGLDCRRSNLRFATHEQNLRNTRAHKDGSSRYKGVSRSPNGDTWRAQIRIPGKTNTYLGSFLSEEEAAAEYDHAAYHHFGEFALLNFPERVEQYKTPWYRKKRKPRDSKSKSQFVGIRPHGKGWVAEVNASPLKYIGTWATELEAATAYDLVTTCCKGPDCMVNFPDRAQEYWQNSKMVVLDKGRPDVFRESVREAVKTLLETAAA